MHPTPLKPGQTLGVCAPSSYVDAARLEQGKAKLESLGYKIFLHPQASLRLGETQMAGTLQERLSALHDLILNPEIHGIIFAGGGNRALELVPHLNFDAIKKARKPIIGFSDVTMLLNSIAASTGLVTFHGPMLNWLANHPQSPDAENLAHIINGGAGRYDWDGPAITTGQTTGALYGGNISVFLALLASGSFKLPRGSILFLEDIGEELNRLDRAYLALAQLATHTKINGIIIGQNLNLTDTGRPFGFNDYQIAQNAFGKLGIPVAFAAPFGHGERLITLPVGHIAMLDVQKNKSALSFVSCSL